MIKSNRLVFINTLFFGSYFIFWFISKLFSNVIYENYDSVLYMIPSIIFAVLTIYAASPLNKNSGYFRLPAFIMSLGLLCNSIGEVLWYLLGKAGTAVEYPSIADVWYLLFYPITFLGLHLLFLYIKGEEVTSSKIGRPIVIESILLFLLGLIVSLRFDSLGIFNNPSIDFSSVFDVLYMIADVLLLVHTFVILSFIGNFPKADTSLVSTLYLMCFSLAMVFVADVMFSYSTEFGFYQNSGIADILYLLFPLLVSISIIKVAYSVKPKSFK